MSIVENNQNIGWLRKQIDTIKIGLNSKNYETLLLASSALSYLKKYVAHSTGRTLTEAEAESLKANMQENGIPE